MNKFKIKKLKNNLPVILAPIAGTETVTAIIMFKTGSKYETRENNGMSHFLEHMFFKGTEKRPNTLQLSSELDVLGGEFNAFTSKEYTAYYVKVAKEKLERGLELLSDMLQNSKFDTAEIEREKGVIIEEYNMCEDNSQESVEDVLEELLYGDTPAGWQVLGTKENIRRFTREDFIKYFKSQYGANSAVLCLAGNIKDKEVLKLSYEYFGTLPENKFKNKIKTVEKQSAPALKIKYKETDQTHLALGVRTFPLGHKDEQAAKMLSVILGGSMSSRLFIEVRERRGLAYYVRTNTDFYTDSGYMATWAGVPLEKLDEAVKIILAEYKRLTEELVSPRELKRTKEMLSGRLAMQLEASDDLAGWYVRQMTLRGNLITPKESLRKIMKVTAKDIQRVAKKIFSDNRLNLAIVGKIKDEKKIKEILKF
ncbi:MAG: pitrilysin family protein [Candidatus Falkowbacteria bacterium]